jgi:hypothetical protein
VHKAAQRFRPSCWVGCFALNACACPGLQLITATRTVIINGVMSCRMEVEIRCEWVCHLEQRMWNVVEVKIRTEPVLVSRESREACTSRVSRMSDVSPVYLPFVTSGLCRTSTARGVTGSAGFQTSAKPRESRSSPRGPLLLVSTGCLLYDVCMWVQSTVPAPSQCPS